MALISKAPRALEKYKKKISIAPHPRCRLRHDDYDDFIEREGWLIYEPVVVSQYKKIGSAEDRKGAKRGRRRGDSLVDTTSAPTRDNFFEAHTSTVVVNLTVFPMHS